MSELPAWLLSWARSWKTMVGDASLGVTRQHTGCAGVRRRRPSRFARGQPRASGLADRKHALGRDTEVAVGAFGGDAPSRGALQQPELEQVRLDHVLDGIGLLPHRRGERGKADRPAPELRDDRVEDREVELV